MSELQPEQRIKRLSRRGFLWGAVAVAFGWRGIEYLNTRRQEDGLQWPFRRVFALNEELAEDYFANTSLSHEYPLSMATMPKVNEDIGMESPLDFAAWRLEVKGGEELGAKLTLNQIKSLPQFDMVTQLRCVEGWATIVHWTGCRLRDFIAKYPPPGFDLKDPTTWPPYVGLETPDGGYYVGLDIQSALHPQTMLCWAMMGRPLEVAHGAPLRLVIPVKYGIKNIKRIGTITYATERPRDYWAENDQGYDWYAGL